ncbi:MAG TPA: hypothetical protein ENN45_03995 [Bacteroidetes bacterium]|nr:hypothetical protein [Bacteroidota bacterium]
MKTCGEQTTIVDDSDVVEVTKMIKQGDDWVNQVNASINDVLRFKISISYHDSDGPGVAEYIRDITIIDSLPDGLEYRDNATKTETSVENNTITWRLGTWYNISETTSPYVLEFDVKVVGHGSLKNVVDVSALEKCISVWRYVNTSATVFVSEESFDYRSRDVDGDGNLEYAYDYNNDSSDGFESYIDPDGSSEAVKSIDGDEDGKTDHFVDTNDDGFPEKYWDPDDDILSDISIIDVDYDETSEWVYDSDGDGELDRYYDPDDELIKPYVVFDLTIATVGDGTVQVAPDGYVFLEDFNVKLTAVAGENYVFDHWSGDLTGNENPADIVMDEDKAITAHFKKSEEDNGIIIEIIKPKENWVYKDNIPVRIKLLGNGTEITGPITVKVRAESDKGIDRVEFYLNGKLQKTAKIGLLHVYRWLWLIRENDTDAYTIRVVAYDKEGNNKSAEIEVNREKYKPIRDHPLLSIGVGAGVVAGLLLLLKNKLKPDEEIPEDGEDDIPDDGDNVIDDAPEEDDTDKSKIEESEDDGENDLFWYIVTGLAIVLLAILGLLYVGRKMYE